MYRRIQQIEYYVVIANQQCWHANKTWNLYSSNAGIQGNVRKQPVQNIHTHSMHIYHWSTVWLYSQTCIFQIHIFGCCLHRFHKIVYIYIYMCIGIDNRIFIQSSYRETQSWSKAQSDETNITHTYIFSYLFFGIDLTKSYTYI